MMRELLSRVRFSLQLLGTVHSSTVTKQRVRTFIIQEDGLEQLKQKIDHHTIPITAGRPGEGTMASFTMFIKQDLTL
jgi:hypothetical protein